MSSSRVEHQVRERVADIARSAGLPSAQVALQALFLLPPDFLDAYEDLFHRALKMDTDGSNPDKGRTNERGQSAVNAPVASSRARGERLRDGMTLGGMGTAKPGKRSRRIYTVKDDKALAQKERIDKTLRKLAREMKLAAERLDSGSGGVALRCAKSGCGKFMDEAWRYCPSCGAERKGKKRKGDEE